MNDTEPNFSFGSPDFVPTSTEMDIDSARTERGILPDAQERLNHLCEINNWQLVTEYQDGTKLPTLDEWVEFRIENQRGTKFYPCFIVDEQGTVCFLKTQVSSDKKTLDSLRNEATILAGFNEIGFPSPKFLGYEEATDESLAYIKLEAITPDQGRVAMAQDWEEKHAISAIKLIKKMENISLESLPDKLRSLSAFQERYKITEIMMDLSEKSLTHLSQDTKDKIRTLKEEAGEIDTTLVHGDMTLKNILVQRNGEILPVDFELAKNGFLGQDAGKLLSSLIDNQPVFQRALIDYITNDDGNFDQNRLRAVIVGMISENLTHLVWRVKELSKDTTTPEERERYLDGITKFEEKIKSILQLKDEVTSLNKDNLIPIY